MADKAIRIIFSFARVDDDHLGGGITWLHSELRQAIQAIIGARSELFVHFVAGEQSKEEVDGERESTQIFVPIVSPDFFENETCRREAWSFLEYEKRINRDDLILPLYLIGTDLFDDAKRRAGDELAGELYDRQFDDWRALRFELGKSVMRPKIEELADTLVHVAMRGVGTAPPDIPEQGPGVRFRINDNGLIDRAPDEPHGANENQARLNSLKNGLIEACDRLLGSSGHNTLGFVLDTIRAYRGAIDRPLVDVQYTDVWRHGQRLQNLADAATREVDRLEPSLEDDQHAALNDLLDLHGPFMLSTEEGRALQAMADRYQATREQHERQKAAVQAFKEAIEDSRGLVTDAVKQVIAETSDELGHGRYPERAAITAETTNRNFLSTAGKAAAYVGNHAAGGIIGGVAVGTAVGSGLVGVSIEALNTAGQASMQFILSHQMMLKGLAAGCTDSLTLAWLNHLIGWLRRRAAASTVPPAPEEAPAIVTNDFWTPGRVFRDIDAPWCPEMVVIPKGTFMMGSPEDEEGRFDDEGPQYRVTLSKAFALARCPATFEAYDFFCEETGRRMPEDEGWGRGHRPAINVSWEDAAAYCDWLSERTGRTYRLPSEAEWEYACRAGTTGAYAFGETIDEKQANFGRPGGTSEVGAYPANAFKLFDMHGNVREWCADWYGGYSSEPLTDPKGPATGTLRVLRGGSWHNRARSVRAASRSAHVPGYRYSVVGFRCAGVQES